MAQPVLAFEEPEGSIATTTTASVFPPLRNEGPGRRARLLVLLAGAQRLQYFRPSGDILPVGPNFAMCCKRTTRAAVQRCKNQQKRRP